MAPLIIGIIILVIIVIIILLAVFVPKSGTASTTASMTAPSMTASTGASMTAPSTTAPSTTATAKTPAVVVLLPRQTITDLGYPDAPGNLTKGWYDIQKQGVANDYCSYIGPDTSPSSWHCALAGGTGYSAALDTASPAPRIPAAPIVVTDAYTGKNFLLKHTTDGKCMDGDGQTWYYNGCDTANKYQAFTFNKSNDGVGYTLKHNATGQCLDGNGSSIYYGPCNGGNQYQTWIPSAGNNLKHQATGKCLDGNGSTYYFGDCNAGNQYQGWTPIPAANTGSLR